MQTGAACWLALGRSGFWPDVTFGLGLVVVVTTFVRRFRDDFEVFVLVRPGFPVDDSADAGHIHLDITGDL